METNVLAKRIRAFRKLKRMTQLELSERLHISIGILGAIERGTRTPDERLLQAIADTLGISKDELTMKDGEKRP